MRPQRSPCDSSRARHRRFHPKGIPRFARFLLVTRKLRKVAVQKATEISCTPETQRLWRAQDQPEAAHVRIARAISDSLVVRQAIGGQFKDACKICHERYSEIES